MRRRMYSTSRLTHVASDGTARMVDVHDKAITHRTATAVGHIEFSNGVPLEQIETNGNKKGDVLAVARIAGIMGAKKTSELIPLCHPLGITKLVVELAPNKELNRVDVKCTVECDGKTGVEMEALTGVQVALLTVYDMCKAVDKRMVMGGAEVVHKSGGKSGDVYNH